MRWGRMKAIVQDRYGSADVLDFRDVARPEFGPEDVLVKVVAAGVDLGAWHFMTGQPYLMRILGFGLRAPRTRVPGTNVAGRVEAVGRDVAGFQPGEQVYGTCRGAYAEYARVRQDKLAPIPTGLSFEQAAVTPYACFAALQALRDHGKVQPDQQVLVVGASGADAPRASHSCCARPDGVGRRTRRRREVPRLWSPTGLRRARAVRRTARSTATAPRSAAHAGTSRTDGRAHRRLRAWWAPRVATGLVRCWRCGVPIRPEESWHLGSCGREPASLPGRVLSMSYCNCRTNAKDRKGDPRPKVDEFWVD